MGKKIRRKLEAATALVDAQMAELQKKPLPKKPNKRTAPIQLPAICGKYPHQRPISGFRTSSCAPVRRSAQLLKYLYCPYAIPGWLIDWIVLESAEESASAAHERSVALLMAIIYEMGSGRSPRHILKPYLSKTEMALFFKSSASAVPGRPVFSHFIYCKAKAKGLPEAVCAKLAQVLSASRLDRKENFSFAQSFVEFCATREVNALSVQDIWDYLSCNRLIGEFSFKGRTLASALNLVNAWHEELNRAGRAIGNNLNAHDWRIRQAQLDALKTVYQTAPGMSVDWRMTDTRTGLAIQVLQLTRYVELINEGRAMHNCVAGYHRNCASGHCQIFSLRIGGERKATIEVRGKAVVQARGSCNRALEGYPLQCMRKWMARFKLAEAL